MDSDHPSHAFSNVKFVEKFDDNAVPQVVKHLSTAGEWSTATSIQNVENHTQVDSSVLEAKKLKIREKRKRIRANQRKKRELSRNLSSPIDSTSPSTLRMQENSIEISSFEPSHRALAFAHAEELVEEVVEHSNAAGQCSAASSTKDPEGHTQVDNNSESKEIKSVKRRKRGRTRRDKKRKLSSDSSLPSKEVTEGTSAKSANLEVLNLVPVPTFTEESMKVVVSVQVLSDTSLKDASVKCPVQFGKDNPDAGSGKLNIEPRSQDGITISSELSETFDGDDVSRPDIGKDGPQPTPLGVRPGELRRKLLVLDINGILMDIVNNSSKKYTPDTIISRKAVFKRPFCDDFLRFCFEKFHVGVWSSRTRKNLKSAIDFLMGELQSKLLFCWNQSHCTKTGFYTLENRKKPMLLKELKKLWRKRLRGLPWEMGNYNESNTLLLDDSPYKALCNPPYTAIFPNPYCYKDVNDKSLGPGGDLRVYLEGIASADDVQKYVETNPFGQQAITNGNASWNFYRKVIQDNSSPTRKNYNFRSARKRPTLHQRYN